MILVEFHNIEYLVIKYSGKDAKLVNLSGVYNIESEYPIVSDGKRFHATNPIISIYIDDELVKELKLKGDWVGRLYNKGKITYIVLSNPK